MTEMVSPAVRVDHHDILVYLFEKRLHLISNIASNELRLNLALQIP